MIYNSLVVFPCYTQTCSNFDFLYFYLHILEYIHMLIYISFNVFKALSCPTFYFILATTTTVLDFRK